ncbi:MAG: SEC-C domain-containing protein [Desulfobacterales bacterium]|nr:SEC-C domain-containing protein [Desulfobacterales bacterium]
MLEEPPAEFATAMQQFMLDSVREIHKVQDPARFLRWAKENYSDYFGGFIDTSNEGDISGIALSTARPLWNSTPLKSHHYKPEPLPKPGRNDRCYCGSGYKFKQCCQRFAGQMQTISAEDVWPVFIQVLSAEELHEVMELQAMPVALLVEIAQDAFDDGDYDFTCSTLDRLFEYPSAWLKDEGDFAINLMCNACDELDETGRKQAFLAKQRKSGNKWLRSGAWQRSSVMWLDMGDAEAAWGAYETAKKLTPKDPSIDTLELYLLLGEEQYEHAQRRAEMIEQKWKRENFDKKMPEIFDFIQQVIHSPESVLGTENTEDNSEILNRLQNWVQSAASIAILPYGADAGSTQPLDIDPLKRDQFFCIKTPASLRQIEAEWYTVFSGEKPFLDHTFIESETTLQETDKWLAFLDKHPQAFNSIMILDDLVSLLQSFGEVDSAQTYEHILNPIYQHAENIITPLGEDKRFDWGFMDNRPFLRLLINHIYALWRRGEFEQTIPMMERQIRLNPQDNQGVRGLLINAYLKLGNDLGALKLAQIYIDDISPEIALGRILALFRLDQHQEAAIAWRSAQEHFKHAKRYLSSARINPPEIDDSPNAVWGSEEEMWMYRQDMHEAWLHTQGIIEWLKKIKPN